jgi:hypothetical protein
VEWDLVALSSDRRVQKLKQEAGEGVGALGVTDSYFRSLCATEPCQKLFCQGARARRLAWLLAPPLWQIERWLNRSGHVYRLSKYTDYYI